MTNERFEGSAADIARAFRQPAHELAMDAEPTAECVDASVLAALAQGGLAEPERARALEHVGSCSWCLLGLDAVIGEDAAEAAAAPEAAARPGWKYTWLLAAAAIALFWVGWTRFSLSSLVENDAQIVALARVEPLDLRITRGTDDDAVALYIDADFAACEELLTARNELSTLGRLLLASVQLLNGRGDEALATAEPVIGSEEPAAREAAWIAAQASLTLGDGPAARSRLEALAQSEGVHAEEARALLADLEPLLDD